MRKLPPTAAEELLEIVMRRYERASTLLTSNRPVEDWGKLLGDTAAVTAMLDRLLHHGHVLKCGPRSWRTRTHLTDPQANEKRNGGGLWKVPQLCKSDKNRWPSAVSSDADSHNCLESKKRFPHLRTRPGGY